VERSAIDVTALTHGLGERWGRIEVVDEIESTNTHLLADARAPDRSVLVSEVQTAGRGRLDRTWVSPPRAGLTFSVLLRPTVPIATWGWLPLLTGVAVRDGIPGVLLKWPNDVLCDRDERKLAGILAQTSGDAVVLGVGLNVSTTPEELPTENATSLALCGASELDRTALLVAILTRLDTRLAQWVDVDGDAPACGLHAAYTQACATIGREVEVTTTGGARVAGTAVGIEPDGRLRLDTGTLVSAGDVEHLRPAR
jgi:BirA family transcriptional regulator, biotin operon repressor / biotin---[acetyl-CoA-carboxylase] ligase